MKPIYEVNNQFFASIEGVTKFITCDPKGNLRKVKFCHFADGREEIASVESFLKQELEGNEYCFLFAKEVNDGSIFDALPYQRHEEEFTVYKHELND